MTSPAAVAYQSDAQKKEQAAVRAYAAAYPAPWLMIHGHIELIISTAAPEVRLLVFPPGAPLNVGEIGIEVGASATVGRRIQSETFHVTSETHIELPVDRVGYLIAEAIAARPGAVDLTKIPKWAKAATAEALTPHRERIEQAQDVLRGQTRHHTPAAVEGR